MIIDVTGIILIPGNRGRDLMGSSMVTLTNSNAFSYTALTTSAFAGELCSIYVRASLLASYKTRAQWSYFSNRFVAGDGVYIDALSESGLQLNESKQYTLNVKRLGAVESSTVSATVTSTDETVISISDVTVTNSLITFTATALAEGDATISVDAVCGDYSTSVSRLYRVPDATWEVVPISGATYGFALNDDGYYESTNKGVNYSYALCKLVFNTRGKFNLYLDCINYAQSSQDYGLISKVDNTLSLSYDVDSSTYVLKSFATSHSMSIQTVDIGTYDEGEHFIYIKYRKNATYHYYNDSLQFKVRMEPVIEEVE